MQLMFNGWLPRAACATALVLATAGCNKGNAAGGTGSGAASASDVGAARSTAYVLVTRTRPEVPEKYFPQARAAHAACAAIAQQMKHAVKPFPVLAPDFVSERTTYASDGKRSMVRKVSYDLDERKMTPEYGCELRIVKGWSTGLVNGGELRSGNLDMDGQVHLDAGEAPPEEPVRASRLASRTVPKRINGVPLKCDGEGDCIVDPAVALVADGPKPVQAAYRIDDVATYGTALIVEPVSLAVGKPIDPAIFSVEKGE